MIRRLSTVTLALVLGLGLGFAQSGCTYLQNAGVGRGDSRQVAPAAMRDIAGVWDGRYPARLPALARLMVGKEAHLYLGERGMMRLVPEGREGRAFIFRGEQIERSSPRADRVVVERAGRANHLTVRIENLEIYGRPQPRPIQLTLTQPGDFKSWRPAAGRQAYFRYEDWRTRGGAGQPSEKLREAIADMERRGWGYVGRSERQVTHDKYPIPLGYNESAERIYMIYSEEPVQNVVYWIDVQFQLVRPEELPFPAFRIAPHPRVRGFPSWGQRPSQPQPDFYTRPTRGVTLILREDDPERAVASKAQVEPQQVWIYVFQRGAR